MQEWWSHKLFIRTRYARKIWKKTTRKADYEFSFNADFQVESYLRHQGSSFVERFDANSILYITRAMDYFDLSKQYRGGLVEAFKNLTTKFLVIYSLQIVIIQQKKIKI